MALPSSLEMSIKTIGGDKLAKWMDLLKVNSHLLLKANDKKISFRKITWFPDKEDKMRVIGV